MIDKIRLPLALAGKILRKKEDDPTDNKKERQGAGKEEKREEKSHTSSKQSLKENKEDRISLEDMVEQLNHNDYYRNKELFFELISGDNTGIIYVKKEDGKIIQKLDEIGLRRLYQMIMAKENSKTPITGTLLNISG